MALYTRTEIRKKYNLKPGYLRVYETRKKLFVTPGGLIDDNNLINKKFLDRLELKRLKELEGGGPTIPASQMESLSVNPNQPAHEVRDVGDKKRAGRPKSEKPELSKEQKAEYLRVNQLDIQKKEADLEKVQAEIEEKKLKISKLEGELIPTDMVREAFTIHFKSVFDSIHDAGDNMITEFAVQAKLSSDKTAKMREKFVHELNKAVTRATVESKKSLRKIIKESATKRERGERE